VYIPSRHQHNEEIRNGVQVQVDPPRRDHMLESCHLSGDHGYVKIYPKKRLSHSGVGGSTTLPTKHNCENVPS
jgi:hypothetical protein